MHIPLPYYNRTTNPSTPSTSFFRFQRVVFGPQCRHGGLEEGRQVHPAAGLQGGASRGGGTERGTVNSGGGAGRGFRFRRWPIPISQVPQRDPVELLVV